MEVYASKNWEKAEPRGDAMSAEGLKYPEWQGPLQDVILEFDQKKLAEKVQRAETLICERLQKLEENRDGLEEREAIAYGLRLLRSIKRDKLGYPDWE